MTPPAPTRNNSGAWHPQHSSEFIHAARVSKTVAEAAERIEKEIPEFIKYLNDEVVPAVRQHSTKALRTASVKLTELADYMEQQKASGK